MDWHSSCLDTFLFAGPEDAATRPVQYRKQESDQSGDDEPHVIFLLVVLINRALVSINPILHFLRAIT
jgi:hypothetical protein